MSTPTDFPANCLTNVHILHDFAEIAYIVCTHAIPASVDNIPDANDPIKILERLRNAEKQFRQNSILVALDTEKLELFTFYRKVDVVKDQRAVLHKFGNVCRSNSCIISAKSAARVLDLLKPDSNRIYKLFTSAILSSIQILPKHSERTIPVGARIHLVPTTDESKLHSGKTTVLYPEWQLHRVSIQVIATGQLVLMVQVAKNALLESLFSVENKALMRIPPNLSLLYLLPTGQVAKYAGGFNFIGNELLDQSKPSDKHSQSEISGALAQIKLVSRWFKDKYPISAIEINGRSRWIQVEIAVSRIAEDNTKGESNSITWKSLMWPAKMACAFKKHPESRNASKENAIEVDPLKIALEWCNSGPENNNYLLRTHSTKDASEELDDGHVFADEIHFVDNYTPQTFGPPIFPASQTVYPTPPEAILTHQTPGVLSMDGFAPTPVPVSNISLPHGEPFLDEEMVDIHEQHPDHVGTGFYDEDLFEEMSDDKYAPNPDAEEPNWDFFDPPGFEASMIADHSEARNELTEANDEQLIVEDEFPPLEILTQHVGDENLVSNLELSKMSPGKMQSVYTQGMTTSPQTLEPSQHVGLPLPTTSNRKHISDDEMQPQTGYQEPKSRSMRRRSTVFEAIPVNSKPEDPDLRYHKDGKFWFDHDPLGPIKQIPISITTKDKRPSSSQSNTSVTSEESSSSTSFPIHNQHPTSGKRTWTEYLPDSPVIERLQSNEIDHARIESEVARLLEIINVASGDDPFSIRIEPFPHARRRPKYNAQKTLMVAQILVDQVSQSSLLRDEYSMQLQCREGYSQVELIMDHSGSKSAINRATVAELTSIPPRTNVRVFPLSSRLICANRAENEILAKQSILPFWDVLGLQPFNEPKDLTVFCIFPKSTNVMDGCVTFLGRLSDTYSSCNLGSHNVGQLSGLTNDGLLTWTPSSTSGLGLPQLCQRFGSVAGVTDFAANTTVVVYMISPSRDAAHYRDMCHVFTLLYESYLESTDGTRNVELVLQIVPLDFVASPETLVAPTQSSYLELAFEIYNRVPKQQVGIPAASCGTVVILDKHRVRGPVFELSSTIISPFAKDGPCLHLAYAYSTDKRWLTAAWTDERGLISFTMSYCLSVANGKKAHSKREVFRSLWDVSHDIMSRSRVKWRLVVTHASFYELEDMLEWQYVNTQAADEHKMMSRLLLLSVELNPDVSIEAPVPAAKPTQHQHAQQASNLSGTPATTPQANSTTSPEQVVAATPTSGGISHATAATPPDHSFDSGPDIETTLVDPTDQSWAVLLAFGLNQSSNFLDVRPASVSGLLIKRTSWKEDTKSLRVIGLSLVAAPRVQPMVLSMLERESILQEMMEQYRGLVTLAISRGCIEKNYDCVPWHIATVVKGSRVLGDVM